MATFNINKKKSVLNQLANTITFRDYLLDFARLFRAEGVVETVVVVVELIGPSFFDFHGF